MDVDAGDEDQDQDHGGKLARATTAGGEALTAPEEPEELDRSTGEGGGAVPTAVQVVASMVDTALRVRDGGMF